MVYKCSNCGAKLEIDRWTEIIKCEYCDSINIIDLKKVDPIVKAPVQSKKNTSVASIIGLIVLLFVGLIAYYSMRQNSASDQISIGGESPYSYHQDGGYLINQNNDNALDIVTMALYTPESKYEIQIIDGKTGSFLESIESNYAQKAKLITVYNEMIFATNDDFTLTIYSKNELTPIKTFDLSDNIRYYECTNDTFYFDTFDDTGYIIDMKNLNLLKEELTIPLSKMPGNYHVHNSITENEMVYKAMLKEKSSKAFFSIIAEKNNVELWNLPLKYEDNTWWNGPILAVSGNTIVTYGKKLQDESSLGYLIGIDKTKGTIKYEQEISGGECRLYDLYFNGEFIITNIYGCFQAFDPETGEQIWSIGNKCELY